MANTPKTIRGIITTTMTTVYTVTASKFGYVKTLQLSNVDGTNPVDVTGQWLDSSNSNVVTRLGLIVTIPAGAIIPFNVGLLGLDAGDALQFQASANGDCELTGLVIEAG